MFYGFPGSAEVKNLPVSAGDARVADSVPGSGRLHGEGNGNLLHYSYLANSMDRGTYRARVHGISNYLT